MRLSKYIMVFLTVITTNLFAEPKLNLYDQTTDNQASSWLSNNAPKQDFKSADEAFKLDMLQDDNSISLIWTIAEHYYLYKKSIQIIDLNTDSPTSLILDLPTAQIKQDKHYGKTLVYFEQLDIKLPKASLIPNRTLKISYQGCAVAGLCYPVKARYLQIDATHNAKLLEKLVENTPLIAQTQISQDNLVNNSTTNTFNNNYAQSLAEKNIFTALLIFFVGGLLLAFTPCILPMLPIISALVVGKNKTKYQALSLSLAYVFGMALSYAFLGGLSGALGGILNLQSALQSPWVLVPFALLFVILSLPMFGLFSMQLPSTWQAKLIAMQNNLGQKTNLLATTIIGFLAALVVSPCLSAPLVAALSFVAQTGNAGTGALALFASGLGMGLPLIVFVTLGAKFLPKSGAWLEVIKKLFGIILLFMAVYLLKNFLAGNVILILSGILLLASAVIIFSKNRLAFLLSVLSAIYAIALIIGGFMGNSDFAKPLNFTAQPSSTYNMATNTTAEQNTTFWQKVASLDELTTILESSTKPVVVLISADWCANCKIVEQDILQNKALLNASLNLSLIKLDITNPDKTLTAFLNAKAIFGPPTFLFYRNNEELTQLRLQGVIDNNEILRRFLELDK